ncbi:hypothetical protein [Achromobacter sp. ACRQX]|uniref:hypothetical protein n=1 Tax=Achromobacter sp. ACRQX TaxID=2918181 RepID=UPI001EF2E361|nr:hypothetical protein [Achromobacter sp. ACRQX]MCG7328020.1 hypothetical protein [Achromobacter sp. ACRQX]
MTQQWKLVPVEPTPEILAAAAVAVWPTASEADIQMARAAAKIVLMSMDAAPGSSLESIALGIATMAPAYRAMLAAAPTPPASAQDDAKDEQAAFEAWGMAGCEMVDDPQSGRFDIARHCAWQAWQARASVAAPAAGDARDAARYRTVRQSVADEANGADQISAAGEAIGLRPGAYPTPEQFDAMIDHIAASQQQEG